MLLFFPAVSPALFLWPLIGGSFKGKEKLQLPVFFFFFFLDFIHFAHEVQAAFDAWKPAADGGPGLRVGL